MNAPEIIHVTAHNKVIVIPLVASVGPIGEYDTHFFVTFSNGGSDSVSGYCQGFEDRIDHDQMVVYRQRLIDSIHRYHDWVLLNKKES